METVYMLHRNGRVEQKLESDRSRETKYEDATRSCKIESIAAQLYLWDTADTYSTWLFSHQCDGGIPSCEQSLLCEISWFKD
jgi:hypothetical protein